MFLMKSFIKGRFNYFFILLFIPIFVYGLESYTRGSKPGEIYIISSMYPDPYFYTIGIFYSEDNGENITLNYQTIEYPPPEQMQVNYIIGDANAGTIYNYSHYNANGLWRSFDYGINWNYLESITYPVYLAGCCEGHIFRINDAKLFRSGNYGLNFNVITDPLDCPISEIGYSDGEFFGIGGNLGDTLYLVHTLNYGADFITVPIDSSVAFHQIGGYFPKIIRGAYSGEVYIVSWWPDPIGGIFKISHSIDTGNTFTHKYTSEPINIYYWGVGYTAGRAPGSFYIIRKTFDDTFTYVHLFIDYSSDYGETFTTFFHDLGDWVGISPIHKNQNEIIQSFCYPNPFCRSVIINFKLPNQSGSTQMKIFDMNGNEIRKFNFSGIDQILWDATNQCGQKVNSGIYLYQIISGTLITPLNKIIYIDPN